MKNDNLATPTGYGGTKRSIREQLTRQILLFVIVLMILVLGMVAVMMTNGLKNNLESSMLAEAAHAEELLESTLTHHQQNLVGFAQNTLVINSLVDISGRNLYLPKMMESYIRSSMVKALSIVDFEGKTILSNTSSSQNYLKETKLLTTLESGYSLIEYNSLRETLVFIEPIIFYKTPQGAVISEVDFSSVAGRTIHSTDKTIHRVYRLGELIWENSDVRSNLFTVRPEVSMLSKKLQNLGLQLEVSVPTSAYFGLVSQVIIRLGLLGVFFAILSVIISRRIGTGITKPIQALCKEVKKINIIAGETFPYIKSNTELYELTDAFNQRSLQLRHEIEERERAETALHITQHAVEHLPDAVFWNLEDGRFEYVNHAGCEISGYSMDDFQTKSIADLVPIFDKDSWKQHWHDLLEINYKLFETELRKKDGTMLPIDVMVNHVDYKGKELNVAFVRDITERIKFEQEKGGLEKQLNQLQKMEAIGTLAGGIAHDFNNVLFPIMSYTRKVMGRLNKDSKDYDQLERVYAASIRAKELVQQILAFSREGDHGLKPIKIHLVIKEAIRLLRSSLPSSIEIRDSVNTSCDPVMADPTQVHQIIMNLGTNAFHAMKVKGGTLTVSLKQVELQLAEYHSAQMLAPGDYLLIEISDTGSGMSPEVLERIFEPYFTTKKQGEGTGLGLAIIHGIVQRYKGQIFADSEPGLGTIFKIYLPCIKGTRNEETPIVEDESLPTGTERIMVVDDEEMIVDMHNEILSSLGYQVEINTNSGYAFQQFQKNPEQYDLVITDMTMPGTNGVELAKQIREIKPDLPIIICSGFSEFIDCNRAKEIGINRYLMKPVSYHDLAKNIRDVLDEKLTVSP